VILNTSASSLDSRRQRVVKKGTRRASPSAELAAHLLLTCVMNSAADFNPELVVTAPLPLQD